MARRRVSNLEGFTRIDITPLMDLTFLLLIVFMIAAPMLEYTVNVSPPKMNTPDKPQVDNRILVSLDAAGNIMVERDICSLPELASRLLAMQQTRPDAAVMIRAHSERPYREVIEIMKTVRHADFTNISLVTQAED